MNEPDKIRKLVSIISRLSIMLVCISGLIVSLLIYRLVDPRLSAFSSLFITTQEGISSKDDTITDGVHVTTGLIEAAGLQAVINNCTNCHSAQLVIQNRMNRERWISTIRWMQRTQNLWDLGDQEEIIIDYLITNYPPLNKGRRQALNQVEWYELEE